MGYLTAVEGRPLSSNILAKTYGTNPVVIRRVLAKLNEAGLVDSKRGLGGGSILGREPSTITLRNVYEAVFDDNSILPRYPVNEGGPSQVLGDYLNHLFSDAEEVLMQRLMNVSIAQMDNTVRPEICRILGKKEY